MSTPTFDATTQQALPSAWTLHLHLLRHGEVDSGGRRLAVGHTDLPLSPRGWRQHEALHALLARRLPPVDRVIASDLQRCAAPAQELARRLGVPLTLEPALREQHMGAWEGRAWEDLTREDLPGVLAYWDAYADAAPPGGESMRDLARRVGAWLDHARVALRGQRVVLLTHTGVIRTLLTLALDHPLDQALRFAPARGTHSALTLAEAGAVLECLGERPELAEPTPCPGRRLALSGSAGTGKTTLGQALARRLDLPFLEEGMRRRIEAGLDLHTLGPGGLRGLVEALWDEQLAAEDHAEATHGGFVSDRSAVDFAAFWLHYRFSADEPATRAFLDAAFARAQRYDRVLLLPWGVLPLHADGVRTANPFLQLHFQTVVEGLLARAVPPERALRLPALDGVEARVGWVLGQLGL